jgi:hypothetical protein
MKHLFLGLVLAGLGVWGLIAWWNIFGLVMRGLIPFTLMVLGLVAIFAGYRKGAQDTQAINPEPNTKNIYASAQPTQQAPMAPIPGGNGSSVDPLYR